MLYSTVLLGDELCGKDTCGAQNRWSLLFVANDFDRYAISHFLHRPQGAVVLNAANSATPAYLNSECKIQNEKLRESFAFEDFMF